MRNLLNIFKNKNYYVNYIQFHLHQNYISAFYLVIAEYYFVFVNLIHLYRDQPNKYNQNFDNSN